MKKILVIGAGRSATTLIQYLLDQSEREDWQVTIADFQEALAVEKAGDHPRSRAIQFDVNDVEKRRREIEAADLVISLLPPHMHLIPGRDCLELNTHLVTASYVSDEMAAIDAEVKEKGLIFLNETGADPGIDHMSAVDMIERVKAKGGEIKAFRSYCGAIVAPESKNQWGYKFTWAPRNIILAGQGIARYIKHGLVKYLPYHHLFRRTETIHVPGHGSFESYANRNSLAYAPLYGLDDVDTLYRATLRHGGYCAMWQAFVEIGMTAAHYTMDFKDRISYRDYTFSFINQEPGLNDRESLAKFLKEPVDSPVVEKLVALDLLSTEKIYPKDGASPADILQHVLMEKWVFEEDDKDMVVMQHQLDYELEGEMIRMTASMVDIGRDHDHTAISRTVGLPLGMCVRRIMRGEVTRTGVLIPNFVEICRPVLEELEEYGIHFKEEEAAL